MSKLSAFSLGLVLLSSSCWANQENLVVSGIPSLAYHKSNLLFTLGGPSIRLAKDDLSFSLSFFPTIRYQTKSKDFTPVLGFGPIIGFKNYHLIAPYYYWSGAWRLAVGLGYKF